MANPVPYNPVPQVSPSREGNPSVNIQTNSAAFGATIAGAYGQLGRVVEGAGDELFARAIALQKLENDALAKEADTQYMIQVGEAHAEFNSLQGRSAVTAYPGYVKKLEAMRADLRSTLPNDDARRSFDASSKGTMGRTIFNGSGHAALQNKRWLAGSSAARVDAIEDQALTQPLDDRAFNSNLEQIKNEMATQGGINGWSDDQIAQETAKKTSEAWAKRIQGVARTRPFAASKMLDTALENGSIRGEAIAPIQQFVRQQMYTTGAREISSNISGGFPLGQQKVDIRLAAKAIASNEGDNYGLRGPEVFDKKTGASRGRALGKYQVMPENLQGWLKDAGLPAMTEDQFLANPEAQDQVFAKVFGGAMDKYGSFNAAASWWFSGNPNVTQANDGHWNVPTYVAEANKALAKASGLADRISAGDREAERLAPKDPMFKDYVQQRVATDFNRAMAVQKNDQWIAKQSVETALMGGSGDTLPTTVEELTATPEVEAAWNRLPPEQQRRYLKVLDNNARDPIIATPETLRRYQALKGMAATNPAEFLDTSMVDERLPMSERKELINLQMKLKAKAEADPRVGRAMQILKPLLEPTGLSTKTKANEHEYYQFTGALQDALTDFTANTKKTPNAEEVQVIGARLLQERSAPSWWNPLTWLSGTTRQYQIPVPDKDAEIIKADPGWAAIGVEPTDSMIQRIYVRDQMKKLYGGSVPKAEERPRPPISR